MEDLSREQVYYREIYILTGYPWCWSCGRDDQQWPKKWHGPFCMDRAHLGHGSGVMRRDEDRPAINILCRRCHILHSPVEEIKLKGELWPTLSLENMIWIKMRYDPEWWDEEYIASVLRGYLPEPEEPPEPFTEEYVRLRGRRPRLEQDRV